MNQSYPLPVGAPERGQKRGCARLVVPEMVGNAVDPVLNGHKENVSKIGRRPASRGANSQESPMIRRERYMKLYYTPGACSMAAHITALEAGIHLDLERVDLATHKTETGADFYGINPKGSVPALQLNDGEILTENTAILLFLAQRKPESGMAPPIGDPAWFRGVEWLSFVATEIHQGYGPLWNRSLDAKARESAIVKLKRRLDFLEKHLKDNPYLLPGGYSVADAYLFVVLNWSDMVKFDLNPWPSLRSYRAIVGDRPAVRRALQAEGLL